VEGEGEEVEAEVVLVPERILDQDLLEEAVVEEGDEEVEEHQQVVERVVDLDLCESEMVSYLQIENNLITFMILFIHVHEVYDYCQHIDEDTHSKMNFLKLLSCFN